MRRLLSLSVVVLLVNACAIASGGHPGIGTLYTSHKGHVTATEATVANKTGEACATNILGLIVTGDASIDAAKAAGGIKKVATVDYSTFGVLGLFAKACTIVKGAGGGKAEKEASLESQDEVY